MAFRQSSLVKNTAAVSLHPSSPSSLLDEEQYLDLALDPPIPIEEQQILHLVPCKWEEFLELEPPPSGFYDYVDGIVVWSPYMANVDHNELSYYTSKSLECSQRVSVLSTPSIQILSETNTREWTTTQPSNVSNSNRTFSSAGGSSSQFDMRHPDFAITRARRDSDGSSTTDRDAEAKKRIQYSYPYTDKLLGIGEITSKSTRNVDLHLKWTAYARSEVPLYIILDRGTETKSKRVIVGSLQPFEGAERSTSGDEHVPPPVRRTRRTVPPASYYRREYRLDEIVNCPYFCELQLTAAQLVDVRFMKNLATTMDNKRRRRAQRTEIAEQQRDESERKCDESERKRDESERELKESKRKLEESERRRNKAEEELRNMKENEASRLRRAKNDVNRKKNEGKSRNPEREDEERKAMGKVPSAISSPKSGSPVRKKCRKQK